MHNVINRNVTATHISGCKPAIQYLAPRTLEMLKKCKLIQTVRACFLHLFFSSTLATI